MKISKLFHLLYASLMCLPLGFIGGTTLYTIFNPNAKDSYSDNYISTSQSVSNASLLIENQEYLITYSHSTTPNYNDVIYYYSSIDVDWTLYGASNMYDYIGFMMNTYHNPNRIFLYYLDSNNVQQRFECYCWGTGYLENIRFTSKSFGSTNNFKQNSADRNYLIYLFNYKLNSLDNSFTYSVNQINENVIFSWAKNSFLAQPLLYITNLFSIPSTSPIITLLSYWLAISIIWLVFDLIMYVPLLVHRWIDKGVLE